MSDDQVNSADSDQVHRLQSPADVAEFMSEFAARATRTIDIFSHQLAAAVYDNEELVREISRVTRRSAQSKVRILVRDTRPLYGCDRALINLVMRLPSRAKLRHYTDGAMNPNYGFFCADQKHLVYLADEPNWSGFARAEAKAESRTALDEFNTLWTYGSRNDPNLRRLMI